MSAFEWLKLVHVGCAVLSVAGFALRGYWVLAGSGLRSHTLTRVLPHMIDTLLLATAVAMLWLWRVSPLHLDWVTAKIVALLLYIGLGMGLMRFATTRAGKWAAYLGALAVALYIIAVARSHSPLGPLVWLGPGA